MAERRMFTQKIIDSDAFLDMPLSTQALYFHLNMRADDDGFVNNPKRIQRTVGASEDDLKLLIAKRFVIGFESGVLVIKHWKMHNTLRKDRYNPTQYQEELALLEVKDNNAYTERLPELPEYPDEENVATTWQPNGNQVATQYSIGKDSIGKVILDNIPDSDESQESPQEKKEIKKKSYQPFEKVIDLYLYPDGKSARFQDHAERRELLTEWLNVRKAKRAAMTSRAVEMNLEKLDKVASESGMSVVDYLKEVICRGWAAFYVIASYNGNRQGNGRKEIVPNWCTDEYEEMVQNHTPVYKKKTAANDEGVKARAEALQKQLSGN